MVPGSGPEWRAADSGIFACEFAMRKLGRFEPMLGRAEIGGIQIAGKSRDDIPAILLGLQGLYLNGPDIALFSRAACG